MTPDPPPRGSANQKIDDLRTSLADKLDELHRRANVATDVLSAARHLREPLVRFGIGVLIGFAFGRSTRSSDSTSRVTDIVRFGLTIATSALVAHAVVSATTRPREA